MEEQSASTHFQSLESNFLRGEQLVLETPFPLAMYFQTRRKVVADQPIDSQSEVLSVATAAGNVETFAGPVRNVMHQHNHFELMYVVKGGVTNYIEDKEVHYQRGAGCLMNRNVTHKEVLAPGATALFLDFSVAFLTELLQVDSLGRPLAQLGPLFHFLVANLTSDSLNRNYVEFTQRTAESQLFATLLDALQQELATQKLGAHYLQKGLVLRLFAALEDEDIFATSQVSLATTKEEFIVNQVLRLIDRTRGVISRDEIAQELHYTPEHLNRLVKKQTGQSMMKYAQKVKLGYIKDCLQHTPLTLAEIAKQVGFQADSQFYRFFKEKTGLSPDQYRKQRNCSQQEGEKGRIF